MMKSVVTFLLVFVVIGMFMGLSYASAQVAYDDDPIVVPDDTGGFIPWAGDEDNPGAMPPLVGGKVPDRPRVYGQPSPDKVEVPNEPVINVWYGTNQKFGNIGNPQEWINILGNVSGLNINDTLTYRLNAGPELPLAIGPNANRLDNAGDFNIEIAYKDLSTGNNQIVITANDGETEVQETVTVNYTPGKTWPIDYDAVWNSSSDIQNIAQVVDGYWQISGDKVIIDKSNWGYDRLLAIGDETWTEYEVTAPITVHSLDPAGTETPFFGSGVGFLMNWQGHLNKAGEQPNADWSRTGAIGWYRWNADNSEALELLNRQGSIGRNFGKVLKFGTEYIFKMSVQYAPDRPAYYRLKIWEASKKEPFEWDIEGFTSEQASTEGSLLLLAHHVEADFGEVRVRNINDLRFTVDVEIDGEGTIGFTPDQEDFGYSEQVIVKAYPEEGHDFAGWTGDYVGAENPAVFLIHKDMELTAHFEPKPPTTLTINTVGGGTVKKDPNLPKYPWGTDVTLTAVPDAGKIFLYWEGDVTGIQNPETVKMDANRSVTAVFGNKRDASPRSDDFSQCELNASVWTVVNPAGDASLEVTGKEAKFTIPGGNAHDMWQTNTDALRIMQSTEDRNFAIEAKYVKLPTEKFQMEGILVQQDKDNWLRFDVYHDGTNLKANVARSEDGSTMILKSLPILPGGASNVWLMVERNGKNWTYSYSFNGDDWTVFHSPVYEMVVTSSGLFAGNSGQPGSVPRFVTRADYFFNTVAPIIPEDQGNTVDVSVTGQGQVQVAPLKETYECNEEVTLKAIPAPDWLFSGWSGDLSGGNNPASLIIKGDYDITANFGRGAEVYLPVVIKRQ